MSPDEAMVRLKEVGAVPLLEGSLSYTKELRALCLEAGLPAGQPGQGRRVLVEARRQKAVACRGQVLVVGDRAVLDNFQMGLEAASSDPDSMIYRGMEMVKKQLDEFLVSQGVEEISAEEELFDPSVHEAVSQEECVDLEEGMILRVIRRGYRMSDRLLRPANVVVARAPEPGERLLPSEEEENK